jgi:hypothetical protein
MPQGKPKKWATAKVSEPIYLGKAGLEVVIWDKWGRTRKGTAVISVGGVRWYPYKAKKPYRITWDALSAYFEQ